MKNVNKAALFNPMLTSNTARLGHRRGQTLVEYALILAIISVVAIGLLINLGQQVKGIYSSIDSAVASAAASH